MRSIVVCAVILCVFACYGASAIPVFETEAASNVEEFDGAAAAVAEVNEVAAEAPSRHKRATCDLLSFAGVNDSACAAHCLVKGFKGGYCNNKSVCVCRN